MSIIKVAKIKNADKPLKAFQISKEVIDELNYGDCKKIKDAIDMSEPGTYKIDNNEAGHFGETVRENDIVRYEEYTDPKNCPAGWNLWGYGLPVTVKSPTEIYGKAEAREAMLFENVNEATNFIKDNTSSDYFSTRVTITDKDIKIQTDWGISEGKINNCFIVKYAKDDFNILTIGTPTVDEYYILDSEDNVVKCLNEF